MSHPRGERLVPAAQFFIDPYTTARRLAGGFPMAGVTIAACPTAGEALHRVALACFGVNSVQIRIGNADAALEGHVPDKERLAEADLAIDAAIHPHSDSFASEAFRRSLVRTLFRRAVSHILAKDRTP